MLVLSACRVASPPGDGGAEASAPVEPARDAAADRLVARCDLLAQDCPEPLGCFPDLGFTGATVCAAPGAGGPLTPCLLHEIEDCDRGLACVDLAGDGFRMCAELCSTTAAASGCVPGAPCQPVAGYRGVGFCVP